MLSCKIIAIVFTVSNGEFMHLYVYEAYLMKVLKCRTDSLATRATPSKLHHFKPRISPYCPLCHSDNLNLVTILNADKELG